MTEGIGQHLQEEEKGSGWARSSRREGTRKKNRRQMGEIQSITPPGSTTGKLGERTAILIKNAGELCRLKNADKKKKKEKKEKRRLKALPCVQIRSARKDDP